MHSLTHPIGAASSGAPAAWPPGPSPGSGVPRTRPRAGWAPGLRRVAALAAAVFLQVAPILRTAEPLAAAVLQPLAILLRWAAGAAALAGPMHAVSGATGLISSQSVDGRKGTALAYRAQIVSDEYGTPESYSASGLPPGLTLTQTGLLRGTISGTPTLAGVFDARVTGWKTPVPGAGEFFHTVTVQFRIADTRPTITTDPLSQNVAAGSRVVLSVAATGSDLSYRWILDDIEVPLGTGPELVLDPVLPEHAGTYRVRVSNPGGLALSNPAILVVVVPPAVRELTSPPVLHAGEPVRLEVVADAAGAVPEFQWLAEEGPVADATGPVFSLPGLPEGAVRDYRVRVTANGLSITSAPVRVAAAGPLVAGVPLEVDGGFAVPVGGIQGRRYQAETAPDVGPDGWSPAGEPVVATGSGVRLPLPRDPGGRFVRVRVLPR